jgi:hypothetical protein
LRIMIWQVHWMLPSSGCRLRHKPSLMFAEARGRERERETERGMEAEGERERDMESESQHRNWSMSADMFQLMLYWLDRRRRLQHGVDTPYVGACVSTWILAPTTGPVLNTLDARALPSVRPSLCVSLPRALVHTTREPSPCTTPPARLPRAHLG